MHLILLETFINSWCKVKLPHIFNLCDVSNCGNPNICGISVNYMIIVLTPNVLCIHNLVVTNLSFGDDLSGGLIKKNPTLI